MPTYAYRCPSCGQEFEKFHKITARARPKCPQCGGRTERMISGGAGLVFKGSGFYITDYKRAGESKREGEKADKPASSEKSKPSETSSKPSKAGGAES